MKKLLILLPLLFVGCSNYKYTHAVQNDKVYKCVDLKNGLYKDADNKVYRISYNVKGEKLYLYFKEQN